MNHKSYTHPLATAAPIVALAIYAALAGAFIYILVVGLLTSK